MAPQARETWPLPQHDLTWLLAPLAVSDFFRRFWGRRPAIVQGSGARRFDALLTLTDLDHILNFSLLGDHVRVVRDGKERRLVDVANEAGSGTTPTLEALYQEFRQGSSILLLYLHQRWPALKRLCRSLTGETSAATQANAYLTPPNARGLGVHHDVHDVFVVQVHGQKRWRIYKPMVELPEPHQPFDRRDVEAIGPPVDDVILSAGDVLYLPRGYPHDANSLDSMSLHIAVGARPITWASTIRDAVEAVIEREPRLRASLPPGFASDDSCRRECVNVLARLLADVLETASPAGALALASERAGLFTPPALDMHLLDLDMRSSITDGTRFRKRDATDAVLTRRGESVNLVFHGKILSMPARLEEDVRYMIAAEQFSAMELPGALLPAERLVLLDRLVAEGFLTLQCPPRAPDGDLGRLPLPSDASAP